MLVVSEPPGADLGIRPYGASESGTAGSLAGPAGPCRAVGARGGEQEGAAYGHTSLGARCARTPGTVGVEHRTAPRAARDAPECYGCGRHDNREHRLVGETVDQGWAAVLAAVVGLVGALGGALAGGYAAIRGAREGAERSARALLEQARRQAHDQFEHWLRQERRLAYADMLRDTDDFNMKLAVLGSYAFRPSTQIEALEALENVHTAHIVLIQRMGPLATVAGRPVLEGFYEFVGECRRLSASLVGCNAQDLPMAAIRDHHETLNTLHARLVTLVAADIQTAPTPDGLRG
jgi:hypothetical protein